MPVSQEVHFAHHLAANEKVTRDRALRKLTRWIRAKSGRQGMEFTEEALMKLWKGLFFCMWMSDKPFVQQELANSIAGLVHCFARRDQSLLFLEAFFKTMAREWFAIDRFRLEKFMMLVRRCFRQGVAFAYGDAWNDENITAFCDTLKTTALCPNSEEIPLGFRLHVVDVFLQELARMHGGELTPEQAILFLQPFFDILMHSNDQTLLDVVRKNIFFLLLDLDREAAELGVDPSTVKLKGSNGTTGDGDSAGEDEEEEDMYDEHGRVLEKGETCQDLPAIPFDYSMIADRLFDMLKAATLKPFNRALITRMVKKFRAVLEEGLVKPKVVEPDVEEPITEDDIEAAANKLEEELEEELEEDRGEVLKLKEEKQRIKPKFGFDTTSGAYEYIVSGDGDSEEDEGLGNGTARNKKRSKAKRLRKKVQQAHSDEEATDTLSDLEDSEDDKMFDIKAASKKRKRCAELSQKAEKVTNADECAFDGAESSVPPKKKPRRRKPKKPKGSSVDDAAGIVQEARKLNGFDKDTSVTEGESQKGLNSVGKVPIVEKKKVLFTAKKADQVILGKAPQKKLLSVSKKNSMGGVVQQQVSKPIVNTESTEDPSLVSLEGKQQRKMEKLLRQRQARKEKKERRLSVLTKGWQVTPLASSANEAKQSEAPATPASLATCAGKTTESTKLHHSPQLQRNSSTSAPTKRVITKTEKSPDASFKSHKIVVAGEVKGDGAKSPPSTQQASGGTIRQASSPLQSNKGASTGPHSPEKNSIGVTKAPHSPLKNHLGAVKLPHSPVQNNGAVAPLQGLQEVSKGMFTSTLPESLSSTEEATASSDNTPVAKLPCTPKASNPVVPAVRKCLTARKAQPFKLAKFSTPPAKRTSTPQEEKKVIFALSKNKAQDPREYFETIKNSPEIPFDASKRPAQGVLKARFSLPSSTPVALSTKKRARVSDVFQSNANQSFSKKRSSASDFF